MEKQKAILQHKIRTIQDKIYDLVQEQKVLQNEFDSLEVITATHDDELDIVIVDSDVNSWSEEKRVYFELVGKLNEPERSEALTNFDEEFFKENLHEFNTELSSIGIDFCISNGFKWDDFVKWVKIYMSLYNNTYQFDKI
jgi:hypothetical protein